MNPKTLLVNLREEAKAARQEQVAEIKTILQRVMTEFVKQSGIEASQQKVAEELETIRGQSRKWILMPITAVLTVAAIGAMWFLAPVSPRNREQAMEARMAVLQAETTALETKREAAQKAAQEISLGLAAAETRLKQMAAQIQEMQARIEEGRQTTQSLNAANTALAASRTAAQQELRQLQELQQHYQFRLMQTAGSAAVVVEIPEDARPFSVEGKTYIPIAQPDPP